MAENVQSETTPSMASLVTGIIGDAERLVKQEVTLARRELQAEFEKLKTAIMSMALGGGVALLGGLLLSFFLVYFLNALTYDRLPLWACFGIVGGLLAVTGGILLFIGATKVSEIQLVPPQTAETMKENVEWLQNQK